MEASELTEDVRFYFTICTTFWQHSLPSHDARIYGGSKHDSLEYSRV